ncbi:MAG: exo-alpha-sialidase, partial [Thermoleophilia bacterium]
VTLAIAGDAFRLLVSRSRDGVVWEMPVTAAEGAPGSLDKEWIVCDTWPQSRFRGRCYLSYLDDGPRQIVTRWSADGGLAWS